MKVILGVALILVAVITIKAVQDGDPALPEVAASPAPSGIPATPVGRETGISIDQDPSPPAAVPGPGPMDNAAAAAVAAIRERPLVGEFEVVPGSLRVISNREARGMGSVLVGTKQIEIEHRHLPDNENNVVVTGSLDFGDSGIHPFIEYLKYQPSTGRYDTLDIDIHR